MCLNVEFSDGGTDYISAKALLDAPTVFKGRTNENRKVVIILKDEFNDEDTVNILFRAFKDYLKLIIQFLDYYLKPVSFFPLRLFSNLIKQQVAQGLVLT